MSSPTFPPSSASFPLCFLVLSCPVSLFPWMLLCCSVFSFSFLPLHKKRHFNRWNVKAESESGVPRRGLQRPQFDCASAQAHVLEPSRPRALGQVLQRRGSGQAALTSEHYGRPPLCWRAKWEEDPPLFPILSSVCSFPISLGVPPHALQ